MKRSVFVYALFLGLIGPCSAFAQGNQIHTRPNVQSQIQLGRTPTLDDALALKSIGGLAANPNGAQIAIEVRNEILILSTKYPFVQVKVLSGSNPYWSPDGQTLAFYSDIEGKSQINVWNAKRDVVEPITQLPDGISPNWKVGGGLILGDPWSLAWSPDSKRIAFCSRRMVGYEALGQEESPRVRVLTKDTSYASVMEGVFRTDTHDGDIPDDVRSRAIKRHPELGFNKVFLIDVQTRDLRQLSLSGGQPFYPSWSPDGTKLLAIVDLDKNIEEWPTHTALALFDVESGREQLVDTPLPINGPSRWSVDGSAIVMIEQERILGFPRIELYLCREDRWLSIGAPRGMAVRDVRWTSDKHSLLVEMYDRFVNTLWLIETTSGRAKQIETHNLAIEYVDQASTGDIFLAASSPTFAHRVFKLRVGSADPLQQVYDPNPQLSGLRFGQQKRVTWTNTAGDDVDGILILPSDYQSGRRYPVLVDVYPSPAQDTLRLFPDELGQLQAANGYVVFRPSIRSPHTPALYSRDENYNEKVRGAKGIPIMLDDFTSGVEYLIQQDIADPQRIGIFGHSNGGWVVNYLISEKNVMAQCAVVWSGHSSVVYQEYFEPVWAHEVTDGNIYSNLDDYIRMSPLFRMNMVHTPLLMIVGDRDWDTWLPEMLMQFSALKHLGKDVTMVRYANEGHAHFNGPDVRDFRIRVDAFFGQHLRADQSIAH